MIVDAMIGFAREFKRFRESVRESAPDDRAVKAQVLDFYNASFYREYKARNPKATLDVSRLIDRLGPDTIILQYYYIAANTHPLGAKHLLDRAADPSDYSKRHAQIHPIIRNYLDKFGYYDIFLVDHTTGHIVYSVFKELDFASSLRTGPYADTNIAQVFEAAVQAAEKGQVTLADFKRYTPSYEAPAGFIASPIFNAGQKVGVAVFQLPLDRINRLMSQREGLGKTGETYLIGPDKLMRSDSYLDPAHHSVKASWADPERGSVNTIAADEVLSGKTGKKIITDYNGNPVLSAYTPVSLGSLTWGLLAEIDRAEAFAAVKHIKIVIGVIAAVSVMLIIVTALLISRSITRPIKKGVAMAQKMAQGDLTQHIDLDQADEMGRLIKTLNAMSANLKQMFTDIFRGTQTLTASATELSAISEQISASAGQTADRSNAVSAAAEQMSTSMTSVAAASEQATANIQMIVSAAEQMTATIAEISKNTAAGSETMAVAVEKAGIVSEKMNELGAAASDIYQVTDTISEISGQTNLLALNATIEAARAGEAGKGFAVVAGEIKALAHQTAEATRQISSKISGVQTTTRESVDAIGAILDVINEINTIVSTVAAAIEEQSATTREIAANVSQAALGLGEVNENVNQTSAVTEQVTLEIAQVSQETDQMSTQSRQIMDSTVELSKLAETLKQMVDRFKL